MESKQATIMQVQDPFNYGQELCRRFAYLTSSTCYSSNRQIDSMPFTFWVHSCSELCKGPSGCTIEQAWKAWSRQFGSQAQTNKEMHLHWLQMLSRAVTAVTAATMTVPSPPTTPSANFACTGDGNLRSCCARRVRS